MFPKVIYGYVEPDKKGNAEIFIVYFLDDKSQCNNGERLI